MQQIQMQYRPVGIEFLRSDSFADLAAQITKALDENKLLHGDWKVLDGRYVQAVCPADWRPVPQPKNLPDESGILVPRPAGRILG